MTDFTASRSRPSLLIQPAPNARPAGPVDRLLRLSLLSSLVLLLGIFAPGHLAAQPDCDPKPALLIDELNRALRSQAVVCDWTGHVKPTFPATFGGGGSYNLPVLGAAIAYIREPIRAAGPAWNMNTWWRDYLRGEVGDRGTDWYYGGQELGSGNYQYANEISIMAVHYQAWKVGNGELRLLARRWLRATFALHALAASPQRPKTFHDGDIEEDFTGYVGPFVAMAGMRSSENHWRNTNRSILFARAAGLVTNFRDEGPQSDVREYLEGNWAGPGGSVYGMTSTNQQYLRDVVSSGTIRPVIQSMYAGLRTVQRIHFIGWQGVRLTLIEKNAHGATAPTYGMVYFQQPRDAAGREVHLLYPWRRSAGPGHRPYRNGITTGRGTLDLIARYIEATNVGTGETAQAPHPAATDRIDNLPVSPAIFHITFGP